MPSLTGSQLFHTYYGFNSSQTGILLGVSTTIGSGLGEVLGGPLGDFVMRRARVKAGGEPRPEARLVGIWPGAALLPVRRFSISPPTLPELTVSFLSGWIVDLRILHPLQNFLDWPGFRNGHHLFRHTNDHQHYLCLRLRLYVPFDILTFQNTAKVDPFVQAIEHKRVKQHKF